MPRGGRALRRSVELLAVPEFAAPGAPVPPPAAVWASIAAATGVTAAPRPERVARRSGRRPRSRPPRRPNVVPLRPRRPRPAARRGGCVVGAAVGAGAVAVVQRNDDDGARWPPRRLRPAGGRRRLRLGPRWSSARRHPRARGRARAPDLDDAYYEVWLLEPDVSGLVPLGTTRAGTTVFEIPAGLDLTSSRSSTSPSSRWTAIRRTPGTPWSAGCWRAERGPPRLACRCERTDRSAARGPRRRLAHGPPPPGRPAPRQRGVQPAEPPGARGGRAPRAARGGAGRLRGRGGRRRPAAAGPVGARRAGRDGRGRRRLRGVGPGRAGRAAHRLAAAAGSAGGLPARRVRAQHRPAARLRPAARAAAGRRDRPGRRRGGRAPAARRPARVRAPDPRPAATAASSSPPGRSRQLCRAAGVPLVLDAAQSLGHVDTDLGADVVYGTSRKWLAGPARRRDAVRAAAAGRPS